MNKKTLKIGTQEVLINPDDLRFTDATLNIFLERISGIIDYIGQNLANAQRIVNMVEQKHEYAFINSYKKLKEDGKSDKTAELLAKGDDEVQRLRMGLIEAKYHKDLLYHHLQALNSAREDAHNRGHMLRKEMDKLSNSFLKPQQDISIDEIIKDYNV
jgi:ribonuclease HII